MRPPKQVAWLKAALGNLNTRRRIYTLPPPSLQLFLAVGFQRPVFPGTEVGQVRSTLQSGTEMIDDSCSLDLQPGACAPRYVYYTTNHERKEPVGTCYVARRAFSDVSEYSPCRTQMSSWEALAVGVAAAIVILRRQKKRKRREFWTI
uniref:Uncharacterized protein n=1 Tax=Timema monikensis TaxID=170555 RepID=A0A7R9HRY9_9NEOP|nr:unnamed protein product [Timema monikensis]